jgi:hypothetical protein
MVERSLMEPHGPSIKRVNGVHNIPLGVPCGLFSKEAYVILTPYLMLGEVFPENPGLKL